MHSKLRYRNVTIPTEGKKKSEKKKKFLFAMHAFVTYV